jgi:cytosine/adenosine deaminase-related metal-dependent hydrolase
MRGNAAAQGAQTASRVVALHSVHAVSNEVSLARLNKPPILVCPVSKQLSFRERAKIDT